MSYIKYSIDGNQVCATFHNFQCLATCPAGFGDSLKEAFINLFKNTTRKPSLNDLQPWEFEWGIEVIENREKKDNE